MNTEFMVGSKWRRRDGEIVTIVGVSEEVYSFEGVPERRLVVVCDDEWARWGEIGDHPEWAGRINGQSVDPKDLVTLAEEPPDPEGDFVPGDQWRRRDGKVVTITKVEDGGVLGDDNHLRWRSKGIGMAKGRLRLGRDSPEDLVGRIERALEPVPVPVPEPAPKKHHYEAIF